LKKAFSVKNPPSQKSRKKKSKTKRERGGPLGIKKGVKNCLRKRWVWGG